MKKRHFPTIAGLSLALAGALAGVLPVSADPPPNVLFILYDDVDIYGDLEPFGGDGIELQTPFSKRLAAEGKKFDHFYTNGSVCSPTRTGFTTGEYPVKFGIGHALGLSPIDRGIPALPAGLPTLARLFADMNYATGAFGKWHLGSSRPEYTPAGVGFEEVAVICNFGAAPTSYYNEPFCSAPSVPVSPSCTSTHATGCTIEKTLEFFETALDSPAGEPRGSGAKSFFAQVWLNAPHTPYHCPPGYTCPVCVPYNPAPNARTCNVADERQFHAAMLDHAEAQLEKLAADLDERGEWENTLVILASDNGGTGTIAKAGTILEGAKSTFLERGVRTPLLIKGPGITSSTVSQPVIGHDLLATLAEYFGATTTYDGPGISFAPLLVPALGSWEGSDRTMFWDGHSGSSNIQQPLFTPYLRYAVRKPMAGSTWKLVQSNLHGGGVIPELYDLGASESELIDNNKAFGQTAIRNHLQAEHSNWRMATAEHLPPVAGYDGADPQVQGGFQFAVPTPPAVYSRVTLEEHPATDIGGQNFSVSFTITPSQLPVPGSAGAQFGQARLVERVGSWSVLIRNDGLIAFTVEQATGGAAVLANRVSLQTGATYRVTAAFEVNRGLTLYVNDTQAKLRQPVYSVATANPVTVGRHPSSNHHPYVGTLKNLAFHPIAIRSEDLELQGVWRTGFETGNPSPFSTAVRGTLSADSDAHRGVKSLEHVSTAASSYTFPWYGAVVESVSAPADLPFEYQLTAWVKAAADETEVELFLFCLNGASPPSLAWNPRSNSKSVHLASTEWRRITHQHQCPPGTTSANFRLGLNDYPGTVNWDDLSVGRLSKSWASYDFEGANAGIFGNYYAVGGTGHTGSKSMIVPTYTESPIQEFALGSNHHFQVSYWAKTDDPGTSTLRLWFFCLDNQNPAQPIAQLAGYCPIATYPYDSDPPPSHDTRCIRSSPGAVRSAATGAAMWQKFSLGATCPSNTSKVGIRLEAGTSGPDILVDDLSVNITSEP
jgi:arylsulfatase A